MFAHLDELGRGSILEGVHTAIDEGWFQREIAESSYTLEKRIQSGRRLVVGVNAFTEGDEGLQDLLHISDEHEQAQVKRLQAVKSDRDADAVARSLDALAAQAADPEINLMPPLLDAVRAYATIGEIMNALAGVFGRYIETPVI